jgi:putative nucleotidyltransferase with HDIG domain
LTDRNCGNLSMAANFAPYKLRNPKDLCPGNRKEGWGRHGIAPAETAVSIYPGVIMRAVEENMPLQIDRTFEMPSIPLVLTKIIKVLDDDSASAQQLEELILHDPSLSARILKLANSAFYSFRTEVKTLSHAIALLGMGLVKSLAIGVTIFESFTKGVKQEGNQINKLWMHSFGTGLVTQDIWSRRARTKKEVDFAFLCGLLHDLGKVVLFKKSPYDYGKLFSREKTAEDPDFCKLEYDHFGIDHTQVGSLLAKQWGFPADLITTIRKHHSAVDAKPALAGAVSVADTFVKQAGIGFDGDKRIPHDFADLMEQLAIRAEEQEKLRTLAANKRQEIEKFFELA